MSKARPTIGFRLFAAALLLAAGAGAVGADELEKGFPQASIDYFQAMDDGIALSPDQVRGRNTWLMWTGGNGGFWDYLARRSSGKFDLLKVLDSRNRASRFAVYGLMNEPGFKQAAGPDQFGL